MPIFLKRSKETIAAKAKCLNLKIDRNLWKKRQGDVARGKPKKPIPNNERKVNPEQFFNIQTPEVAYILGLIWADGYVDIERISLSVVTKDMKDYIPIFLKTGNWNASLSKQRVLNEQPQQKIRCYNKPLSLFLIENDYRIKSKSSPDKILSKIPKHLQHYFLGVGLMVMDVYMMEMD